MDAQSFQLSFFADSLMKDHEDKSETMFGEYRDSKLFIEQNPIKIYEEKAETENQNNTVVFNLLKFLTP